MYVTPALAGSAILDLVATTHVLWTDVHELIQSIWLTSPEPDEVRAAEYLLRLLDGLHEQWTPTVSAPAEPDQTTELTSLLAIAELVAGDGQQRAADIDWTDPQDMEETRVALRDALITDESPVRPWIWNAQSSGGKPLTEGGAVHGLELRLSRYGTARSAADR